jgi:hypothetical protein
VSMSEEMRTYLLACYRNHLVIYNDIVDLHRKHHYRTYREVKEVLAKMLQETKTTEIIKTALANEIYYLFKKADYKHKQITDIQYISAITDCNYKNHTLFYQKDTRELFVAGCARRMTLTQPLPVLSGYDSVYLNLSYSCGTDLFEVSVFATETEGVSST